MCRKPRRRKLPSIKCSNTINPMAQARKPASHLNMGSVLCENGPCSDASYLGQGHFCIIGIFGSYQPLELCSHGMRCLHPLLNEFLLDYATGRALGLCCLYNTWTPLVSNVLTALPGESLVGLLMTTRNPRFLPRPLRGHPVPVPRRHGRGWSLHQASSGGTAGRRSLKVVSA